MRRLRAGAPPAPCSVSVVAGCGSIDVGGSRDGQALVHGATPDADVGPRAQAHRPRPWRPLFRRCVLAVLAASGSRVPAALRSGPGCRRDRRRARWTDLDLRRRAVPRADRCPGPATTTACGATSRQRACRGSRRIAMRPTSTPSASRSPPASWPRPASRRCGGIQRTSRPRLTRPCGPSLGDRLVGKSLLGIQWRPRQPRTRTCCATGRATRRPTGRSSSATTGQPTRRSGRRVTAARAVGRRLRA